MTLKLKPFDVLLSIDIVEKFGAKHSKNDPSSYFDFIFREIPLNFVSFHWQGCKVHRHMRVRLRFKMDLTFKLQSFDVLSSIDSVVSVRRLFTFFDHFN